MILNILQIINHLVDVNDVKYDRNYSRVAKLHKYWSRKPWFIIDRYIEKYSKKNDVVLDPFCGSGIIGLQAVLANRNFVGYDLNPFAVFLAKNSVEIDYDKDLFDAEFLIIEKSVKDKIMRLYKQKDKYILYTILGKKNSKNYNAVLSDNKFQNKEKATLSKSKLSPAVKFPKELSYPDKDFPAKFYKDRFSYKGVRRVSDMFTKRNLLALALLYNEINKSSLKNRDLFMLAFTNTLLHVSKLKAENVRPLSVNNFWIPDDFIEENVWWRFADRAKNVKVAKGAILNKASERGVGRPEKCQIYNKSSLKMAEIKTGSVDYLITDPPYGDTIQYSELSYIWNCWLGKDFDIKDEVIINPAQEKGVNDYYEQLVAFVCEARRVLKKDAYFTLAFQNKDLKIWVKLAELIRNQGMELVDISAYDTFGNPYNKNWAKFSPKSDFYVTFKNSQKGAKNLNPKRIYPAEIAGEIVKGLKKRNGKIFDLNKAYDLFVGVVINKIFEGSQIANHEKLSIKNVTQLFSEVTQYESMQPRLLELDPA